MFDINFKILHEDENCHKINILEINHQKSTMNLLDDKRDVNKNLLYFNIFIYQNGNASYGVFSMIISCSTCKIANYIPFSFFIAL